MAVDSVENKVTLNEVYQTAQKRSEWSFALEIIAEKFLDCRHR